MKLMPQEIEVRYVLPAIRKEIAKELLKNKIKQKEIAKILDMTPAAISQYLKKKRGKTNFSEKFLEEIKKKSKIIFQNYQNKKNNEKGRNEEIITNKEIYQLSKVIKEKKDICKIHRQNDEVPTKCNICYQ